MTNPTLAVALIIKNEEKHLASCLDSVKGWVDEIIILDSGSTDKTEEIAKQYTDKFYSNLDWPGFGPQRQIAQQYVTADYILWLDADEQVTPELKQSIQASIDKNQAGTIYQLNRLSTAFGKQIKHSGWSPDWVVRLHKTKETQYNDALVHEKIEEKGLKVSKLDGFLLHDTYDNLHHYINKTTGYIKTWSDERESTKKSSLFTAITHALSSFIKMYFIKLGFLDGRHGFILAWLTMHSTFVKYTDLWLRDYQRDNKK